MNYFIILLASLSVVLNTITGGSYRNTFSARTGLASMQGAKWAKITETGINTILFSGNHCHNEAKNEGLLDGRQT